MARKLSWTHWWEHMWLVYESMDVVCRFRCLKLDEVAPEWLRWENVRPPCTSIGIWGHDCPNRGWRSCLAGDWISFQVTMWSYAKSYPRSWHETTIHCIHWHPTATWKPGTASLMFIAPCFASLCVCWCGSSSSKNGAFRHRTRWPWRFSATVPIGRFGKRMKRWQRLEDPVGDLCDVTDGMAVGFKWILSKKRDQAVMIYIEISTVPTARAPSHQTKLGLAVDVLFDFLAPKIGIIHNSTKSSQIISPKIGLPSGASNRGRNFPATL